MEDSVETLRVQPEMAKIKSRLQQLSVGYRNIE
jgi:hypothetical protein